MDRVWDMQEMAVELRRLERRRQQAEASGDVAGERGWLLEMARWHSKHSQADAARLLLLRALALDGCAGGRGRDGPLVD